MCVCCVFFLVRFVALGMAFFVFYFFVLCVFEVERVMGGVGVDVLYLDP